MLVADVGICGQYPLRAVCPPVLEDDACHIRGTGGVHDCGCGHEFRHVGRPQSPRMGCLHVYWRLGAYCGPALHSGYASALSVLHGAAAFAHRLEDTPARRLLVVLACRGRDIGVAMCGQG